MVNTPQKRKMEGKKKKCFWTPQEQYKVFGPREIKSELFDQKSLNPEWESRVQKCTQVWQDSDGQRPFDSPNILLLNLFSCSSDSSFPFVCFLGGLPQQGCAIALFLTQFFTLPFPEVSTWALTSHSLWSSFQVASLHGVVSPQSLGAATCGEAETGEQNQGLGQSPEGRTVGGPNLLCPPLSAFPGFKQPALHIAVSPHIPALAHKSEMNLDTLFQQIQLTEKQAGEKRRLIQQG